MFVRDFDGDGHLDVMAGRFGSSTAPFFRIWWGDGTSVLPANTSDFGMPGGYFNSRATPCDVDNDGDLDILLARDASGFMDSSIMVTNQGNRSFTGTPNSQYPLRNSGSATAYCVDLDADGFDEVLLVSTTGSSRLMWNNAGTFVFATPQEFPTLPQSLRGMAAADFDDDGDLDVALGGADDHGTLLLRTGPRTFVEAAINMPPPRHTVALRSRDINGDGLPDLHAFGIDRGESLLSDGTGNFAHLEFFGSQDKLRSIADVDLDSDGDIDILRYGRADQLNATARLAFSFIVHGGLLEHVGGARLPAGFDWAGASPGDINGDGLVDIVGLGADDLQFATNDGRGVFHYEPQDFGFVQTTGFFGDLNADGHDEFIRTGTNPGIHFNSNGRLHETPQPLGIPGARTGGCVFDIDNDGDGDLALIDSSTRPATLRILINHSGTLIDETTTRLNSRSFSSGARDLVMSADMDQDGDLDIWISTDADQLILANQNGVLNYVAASLPNVQGGLFASTGDIDGDGDLDLHTGRRLFLNTGGLTFTDATNRVPLVAGLDSLGRLVDVDDDGDLDLAGFSLVAWNDGNGFFTPATNAVTNSTSGGTLLWTDVDRDGDPDMLTLIGFPLKLELHTNMLRQAWFAGPARIGGSLRFRFRAEPGENPLPVLMVFACAFETRPATQYEIGWLSIDPAGALLVGPFSLPAAGGTAQPNLPLPNDPAFQGLRLSSHPIEIRGTRVRAGNLISTHIGQ
ncbi:MAG: VCBS repeat-containing protein [bacterium]|nr:VCBS repeat-containing protein [bacterium]